jgi:KDO2-lipid IV(A) lauroyltransferase
MAACAPTAGPGRAATQLASAAPADIEAADVREGGTWTRRQRLKNDLLYVTARVALAMVTPLPRAVVRVMCAAMGLLVYACSPALRARVRQRLAAGLGATPEERRVRRAFVTSGLLLADTLSLLDPAEPAKRTLRLTDASRATFAAAIAERRGVVFVTAHLGPWERMAALLAAEGFPVATVARDSYDPRFTRLYQRLRTPRGVRCLWRGRPGVGKQIVRELRLGRAVGFLIDLPGRSPSIECPLFGAQSRVASGAARMAQSLGAQVLLGTPVPAASGGFEVLIERLDPPAGATDEGRTRHLAAALTRRIEALPEAWVGLFARG